jgi:hypothetical protein
MKIAYLRFIVPTLAPGTTIDSASLTLLANAPSRCSGGVQVFRAATDTWGERTITWNMQPGSVGGPIASQNWTGRGSRSFEVTSAVVAGSPVSFLVRHPEGCSVSADTSFNSREASTGTPQLVLTTTSSPPPAPACSDLADNDGDGKVDLLDPGCTDGSDPDETDPPPPASVCSDALDNDGDGLFDLTDPGCADGYDHAEIDEGAEEVLVAAGDIACDPLSSGFSGSDPAMCQHRGTAALLAEADAVAPLGDLQYRDGSLSQFLGSYDPSWGVAAGVTYPSVGNHEYHQPLAQGYFDYWTSKGRPTGVTGEGYYSYDLGSWHAISLNSNCSVVACAEPSPQNDWLERDLAATTQPCVVAYWHHPYFNSGSTHGASQPAGALAFWDDLYAARADIVLNGHEHNYQRYAKQTPQGIAASDGIREFVVGTGGRGHYGLLATKDPNYETGNATDFGVLRFYLAATSYRWVFVGLGGTVLDSGGPIACNGALTTS